MAKYKTITEDDLATTPGQVYGAPIGPHKPDWFARNIAIPMGATFDPTTGRYSGSYLTAVVDPLAQGATLGLMDEAEALGGATGQLIKQQFQPRDLKSVITGLEAGGLCRSV